HEGFGRNFASKLSAMLRTLVEVHLSSVEQMTYSEFILALDSPTCFNVLRPDPLDGNFLLDISPEILFPLIDRMLGGGKERSQVQQRAVTEIERRLVTRITRLFIEELQVAWESLIKLHPVVERIESNPQLAQVVPPNEVVVVLSFETTLLGYKGPLSLCIPYNSIERISSKLSQNTWAGYGGGEATEESQGLVSHNLRAARVEVRVELARTKISTADLIGLGVGDVITTEKDVQSPLILMVEGAKKFRCTAGAYKGRKAVRVVGPINEDPGAALRLS
ncbi:MAG: flagellar motor switch protein FliM, partial [Myxococcales bacterium]|nr:flagellar motor switch protein FliM [Myxococcales bacterium]